MHHGFYLCGCVYPVKPKHSLLTDVHIQAMLCWASLRLNSVSPSVQLVDLGEVVSSGPDVIERSLRGVLDSIVVFFTELLVSVLLSDSTLAENSPALKCNWDIPLRPRRIPHMA